MSLFPLGDMALGNLGNCDGDVRHGMAWDGSGNILKRASERVVCGTSISAPTGQLDSAMRKYGLDTAYPYALMVIKSC